MHGISAPPRCCRIEGFIGGLLSIWALLPALIGGLNRSIVSPCSNLTPPGNFVVPAISTRPGFRSLSSRTSFAETISNLVASRLKPDREMQGLSLEYSEIHY